MSSSAPAHRKQEAHHPLSGAKKQLSARWHRVLSMHVSSSNSNKNMKKKSKIEELMRVLNEIRAVVIEEGTLPRYTVRLVMQLLAASGTVDAVKVMCLDILQMLPTMDADIRTAFLSVAKYHVFNTKEEGVITVSLRVLRAMEDEYVVDFWMQPTILRMVQDTIQDDTISAYTRANFLSCLGELAIRGWILCGNDSSAYPVFARLRPGGAPRLFHTNATSSSDNDSTGDTKGSDACIPSRVTDSGAVPLPYLMSLRQQIEEKSRDMVKLVCTHTDDTDDGMFMAAIAIVEQCLALASIPCDTIYLRSESVADALDIEASQSSRSLFPAPNITSDACCHDSSYLRTISPFILRTIEYAGMIDHSSGALTLGTSDSNLACRMKLVHFVSKRLSSQLFVFLQRLPSLSPYSGCCLMRSTSLLADHVFNDSNCAHGQGQGVPSPKIRIEPFSPENDPTVTNVFELWVGYFLPKLAGVDVNIQESTLHPLPRDTHPSVRFTALSHLISTFSRYCGPTRRQVMVDNVKEFGAQWDEWTRTHLAESKQSYTDCFTLQDGAAVWQGESLPCVADMGLPKPSKSTDLGRIGNESRKHIASQLLDVCFELLDMESLSSVAYTDCLCSFIADLCHWIPVSSLFDLASKVFCVLALVSDENLRNKLLRSVSLCVVIAATWENASIEKFRGQVDRDDSRRRRKNLPKNVVLFGNENIEGEQITVLLDDTVSGLASCTESALVATVIRGIKYPRPLRDFPGLSTHNILGSRYNAGPVNDTYSSKNAKEQSVSQEYPRLLFQSHGRVHLCHAYHAVVLHFLLEALQGVHPPLWEGTWPSLRQPQIQELCESNNSEDTRAFVEQVNRKFPRTNVSVHRICAPDLMTLYCFELVGALRESSWIVESRVLLSKALFGVRSLGSKEPFNEVLGQLKELHYFRESTNDVSFEAGSVEDGNPLVQIVETYKHCCSASDTALRALCFAMDSLTFAEHGSNLPDSLNSYFYHFEEVRNSSLPSLPLLRCAFELREELLSLGKEWIVAVSSMNVGKTLPLEESTPFQTFIATLGALYAGNASTNADESLEHDMKKLFQLLSRIFSEPGVKSIFTRTMSILSLGERHYSILRERAKTAENFHHQLTGDVASCTYRSDNLVGVFSDLCNMNSEDVDTKNLSADSEWFSTSNSAFSRFLGGLLDRKHDKDSSNESLPCILAALGFDLPSSSTFLERTFRCVLGGWSNVAITNHFCVEMLAQLHPTVFTQEQSAAAPAENTAPSMNELFNGTVTRSPENLSSKIASHTLTWVRSGGRLHRQSSVDSYRSLFQNALHDWIRSRDYSFWLLSCFTWLDNVLAEAGEGGMDRVSWKLNVSSLSGTQAGMTPRENKGIGENFATCLSSENARRKRNDLYSIMPEFPAFEPLGLGTVVFGIAFGRSLVAPLHDRGLVQLLVYIISLQSVVFDRICDLTYDAMAKSYAAMFQLEKYGMSGVLQTFKDMYTSPLQLPGARNSIYRTPRDVCRPGNRWDYHAHSPATPKNDSTPVSQKMELIRSVTSASSDSLFVEVACIRVTAPGMEGSSRIVLFLNCTNLLPRSLSGIRVRVLMTGPVHYMRRETDPVGPSSLHSSSPLDAVGIIKPQDQTSFLNSVATVSQLSVDNSSKDSKTAYSNKKGEDQRGIPAHLNSFSLEFTLDCTLPPGAQRLFRRDLRLHGSECVSLSAEIIAEAEDSPQETDVETAEDAAKLEAYSLWHGTGGVESAFGLTADGIGLSNLDECSFMNELLPLNDPEESTQEENWAVAAHLMNSSHYEEDCKQSRRDFPTVMKRLQNHGPNELTEDASELPNATAAPIMWTGHSLTSGSRRLPGTAGSSTIKSGELSVGRHCNSLSSMPEWTAEAEEAHKYNSTCITDIYEPFGGVEEHKRRTGQTEKASGKLTSTSHRPSLAYATTNAGAFPPTSRSSSGSESPGLESRRQSVARASITGSLRSNRMPPKSPNMTRSQTDSASRSMADTAQDSSSESSDDESVSTATSTFLSEVPDKRGYVRRIVIDATPRVIETTSLVDPLYVMDNAEVPSKYFSDNLLFMLGLCGDNDLSIPSDGWPDIKPPYTLFGRFPETFRHYSRSSLYSPTFSWKRESIFESLLDRMRNRRPVAQDEHANAKKSSSLEQNGEMIQQIIELRKNSKSLDVPKMYRENSAKTVNGSAPQASSDEDILIDLFPDETPAQGSNTKSTSSAFDHSELFDIFSVSNPTIAASSRSEYDTSATNSHIMDETLLYTRDVDSPDENACFDVNLREEFGRTSTAALELCKALGALPDALVPALGQVYRNCTPKMQLQLLYCSLFDGDFQQSQGQYCILHFGGVIQGTVLFVKAVSCVTASETENSHYARKWTSHLEWFCQDKDLLERVTNAWKSQLREACDCQLMLDDR
eukprot:gb/GECG01011484.1/.p1 GENE.gb/GECG01011484.1/~~gb/GECG01011484.1/.p1  ORF type:complete len:2401 (+),score=232.88 gb/GECG01011484.1/:1-7203(+)